MDWYCLNDEDVVIGSDRSGSDFEDQDVFEDQAQLVVPWKPR